MALSRYQRAFGVIPHRQNVDAAFNELEAVGFPMTR